METCSIEKGLNWLDTPIQYAKGIGPRLAVLFNKLNIHTFEDLLYHLPFRYLDRRSLNSMDRVEIGKNQCLLGEVQAAGELRLGRGPRHVFEVVISDGKGHLLAKWFHYNRKFFERRFKKGERFLFFGEVSFFRGEKQMVHPEVKPLHEFVDEEALQDYLGLVPVYSSTEGLIQGQIRKAVKGVLQDLPERWGEIFPEDVLARLNLPSWEAALRHLHQAPELADATALLQGKTPFHRRLIFEELFFLQLGLQLRRRNAGRLEGFFHEARVELRNRLLASLPFELTRSQVQASEQIALRMCRPDPMNLLLQGDVGSGKTLVSLLACLLAVENKFQAVLMVPTEILAEQHFKNFKHWLEPLGIPVFLLTASTKSSERKNVLAGLQQGLPGLTLGTHALLEEEVRFQNLSLVVVDEQHRFGVRQRLQLMGKGRCPDILVMTATPIPRSLSMTLYGDLDLCVMTDLPRGRKPIATRVMREKDRSKLYDFVRKKLAEGRQAYFVFPLIEESEKLDLQDATRAYGKLQQEFEDFRVGMIHGRMKALEKEAIMGAFKAGEIQVLVATTVIEVGIDVPNASLMIVEHAERFGLSQLHQLRGRVGRGSEKSYCILATGCANSELARARLQVMERYSDGFSIAEEDLKIRGPGDFLGTRQSGLPELRVANLVKDMALLEAAQNEAKSLLDRDPLLQEESHWKIRQVLQRRWASRLQLAQVG